MNERIKVLALQAFGSTIDNDPILVYEADKFAELVVKECYNVAEEHDCNLSGNGGEILKHFGLEE